MTTTPGAALRRIRGERSLRSFAALLVEHGFPPGTLSRQRISQVEAGRADLSTELWAAVRAALRAAGYGDAETAPLVMARPTVITPLAESTPPVRRNQWQRLLENVPGNRWWQPPTTIAAQVLGSEWIDSYHALASKHGIDVERDRRDLLRRLAVGGQWDQDADDRVSVHPDDIDQISNIAPGGPFVFTVRLYNTGNVPWTDRMLYRLGPQVTSSLPFAPVLVPVPDAEPGRTSTVVIPGRGQVFPNLAIMTYTMVFADCSQSVPGSIPFLVDTRSKHKIDRTIPPPTTT